MEKPKIAIKTNHKTVSLGQYAGEWVAFAHGKVVAHQGTLKKLMKKVKNLKNKPSVLLIPRKSEGPYI
ncbi:MAG: DUF5678 domain-containing protein [Thermodesulfobacteriota bacterium]|jgi:N-acetylneuraminic acid mutarotase|nr:MAG: DUF5678 domain-containing protein [Thermodesulfobacteriota bacterium]